MLANIYCPICGEENYCMIGDDQGDCWCTKENFPQGIFELVPKESKRKHCICRKCLLDFREETKKKLR